MSQQLKKQLAEGDGIVRRLSRIAIAARPGGEAEPESEPVPARAPAARAIAAAAQAFSERKRANGLAA